jgi:serine/arginine repetitive matrix protein 2
LLAKDDKQPLTLSDIIPPPSHVRSLSNSTSMDDDNSALSFIFTRITGAQGHSCTSSDAGARQIAKRKEKQSQPFMIVGESWSCFGLVYY